MKNVLVLDSNQRSALAVTRSLGQQGIQIFTAEEISATLASNSKFTTQHFVYPSPREEPEQFIAFLINLIMEKCIDIVLPMTELTTTLLLLHRDAFPNTVIPFPDLQTVESLDNKCSLMRAAESHNIAIPQTWYEDNPDKLNVNLDELAYPVVLKPGKSWLFYRNRWARAGVQFAKNSSEAKDIINSYWAFKAHPFMIQNNVDGYGAGIFAIYDHGKPLAFFAHRRLREKPPSGGVSVLSESIAINPELKTATQTLLNKANWHGVAMVEFKIASDGTPYLMEINTRFWGSLQLAIDAGVNFPFMLYQLACGKHPESVADYKTGIKLRWLLGDLDNLYLTLRDKHISYKNKFTSLISFITPSLFSTRHEVNRIKDLKPFWHEIRQYIRDILD